MKKKIVITALTAMLAASMVMPVYADNQPPIKWNVDAEQYKYDDRMMIQDWAAQYKDELLAIPDESARYDRIFQIVTEYLSIKGTASQAITSDEFRRGLGGCGTYVACINELCKLLGIESYTVDGYNGSGDDTISHMWNLVKINGEYFYSDAMRADKFDDYEYCMKTKELWPTFTIAGANLQHWTADEYLTRLQQLYDADKPDPSVLVDPDSVDWDNPSNNSTTVYFIDGQWVTK